MNCCHSIHAFVATKCGNKKKLLGTKCCHFSTKCCQVATIALAFVATAFGVRSRACRARKFSSVTSKILRAVFVTFFCVFCFLEVPLILTCVLKFFVGVVPPNGIYLSHIFVICIWGRSPQNAKIMNKCYPGNLGQPCWSQI